MTMPGVESPSSVGAGSSADTDTAFGSDAIPPSLLGALALVVAAVIFTYLLMPIVA
jgi:hypothetical protein